MDALIFNEVQGLRGQFAAFRGEFAAHAAGEAAAAATEAEFERSEAAWQTDIAALLSGQAWSLAAALPWSVGIRSPIISLGLLIWAELSGKRLGKWFLALLAFFFGPLTSIAYFAARSAVRRTSKGREVVGGFCCGENRFNRLRGILFGVATAAVSPPLPQQETRPRQGLISYLWNKIRGKSSPRPTNDNDIEMQGTEFYSSVSG